MTEDNDGFTFVRRRKRGKRPTIAGNERKFVGGERQPNLEFVKSPEGRVSVDKTAIEKKILTAREELTISDFYRTFKDSLEFLHDLKPATADCTPTPFIGKSNGNAKGIILQQTNSPSADSKLGFVDERVEGNAGKNNCRIKPTERMNTELMTGLHLEDGEEKKDCTQTECDEDSAKSWQIHDLKTKRTEDRFSDDLGDEKVIGQSVQSVVCYGLGNFSECAIARYQLALLMLICDFLKIIPSSCFVYDPRFTTEETQILASFGLEVIQQNEEGKRQVTWQTLFYMPHCGKPLYNNLLWANWSVDGLSNVVIVGNSFSTIQERLPSRMLEKEFSYLHQIMTHTREVPVKNIFRFVDIFNDMSIHVFPSDRLQTIPKAFWDRQDEPQYDPDAGFEIILHQ